MESDQATSPGMSTATNSAMAAHNFLLSTMMMGATNPGIRNSSKLGPTLFPAIAKQEACSTLTNSLLEQYKRVANSLMSVSESGSNDNAPSMFGSVHPGTGGELNDEDLPSAETSAVQTSASSSRRTFHFKDSRFMQPQATTTQQRLVASSPIAPLMGNHSSQQIAIATALNHLANQQRGDNATGMDALETYYQHAATLATAAAMGQHQLLNSTGDRLLHPHDTSSPTTPPSSGGVMPELLKEIKRERTPSPSDINGAISSSTILPGTYTPTSNSVLQATNPPIQAQNKGVPIPAVVNRSNAPVHIDVGGTAYTSTLETLNRFPDSVLSKMFTGEIPIVLDSLKQHYFLDRDGTAFRYILNYMRTGAVGTSDPDELKTLLREAQFYEIQPLKAEIHRLLQEDGMKQVDHQMWRKRKLCEIPPVGPSAAKHSTRGISWASSSDSGESEGPLRYMSECILENRENKRMINRDLLETEQTVPVKSSNLLILTVSSNLPPDTSTGETCAESRANLKREELYLSGKLNIIQRHFSVLNDNEIEENLKDDFEENVSNEDDQCATGTAGIVCCQLNDCNSSLEALHRLIRAGWQILTSNSTTSSGKRITEYLLQIHVV